MLIKIKLPRRAVHSLAFDIFRRRQDAFLPHRLEPSRSYWAW